MHNACSARPLLSLPTHRLCDMSSPSWFVSLQNVPSPWLPSILFHPPSFLPPHFARRLKRTWKFILLIVGRQGQHRQRHGMARQLLYVLPRCRGKQTSACGCVCEERKKNEAWANIRKAKSDDGVTNLAIDACHGKRKSRHLEKRRFWLCSRGLRARPHSTKAGVVSLLSQFLDQISAPSSRCFSSALPRSPKAGICLIHVLCLLCQVICLCFAPLRTPRQAILCPLRAVSGPLLPYLLFAPCATPDSQTRAWCWSDTQLSVSR